MQLRIDVAPEGDMYFGFHICKCTIYTGAAKLMLSLHLIKLSITLYIGLFTEDETTAAFGQYKLEN